MMQAHFTPAPTWAPVTIPDRLLIIDIQRAVAKHYRIPVAEMTSARRSKYIARPRQVAMYLARQLTPRSIPVIGRHFGDRDHTTVLHGIKATAERRAADPELDRDIQILTARLAPAVITASMKGAE